MLLIQDKVTRFATIALVMMLIAWMDELFYGSGYVTSLMLYFSGGLWFGFAIIQGIWGKWLPLCRDAEFYAQVLSEYGVSALEDCTPDGGLQFESQLKRGGKLYDISINVRTVG